MGRIFKIGKIWYIDVCYRGKRIRKAVGPDKKSAEKVLKKVSKKFLRSWRVSLIGKAADLKSAVLYGTWGFESLTLRFFSYLTFYIFPVFNAG